MISYLIMAIAGIGAIVGWSKSKSGATWGQPLTVVCAIIAIGAVCSSLFSFGTEGKRAQDREIEYQKVQTRKLGVYLKEKFSGKSVIILKDPYSTSESASITGLKEGMDGALNITEEIAPVPPKSKAQGPDGAPMDMMEPLEIWFTGKDMDKLLSGKKFDILVTTIGLPNRVGFTGNDFNIPALKGKKVALAGGSIYEHALGIKKGGIVAAVTYKMNAEYDEKPVPKNLDTAFDKRYVLVTPENIDTIGKEYSNMFQK